MVDISQIGRAIQKVASSVPAVITGTVSGSTETGVLVILDNDPSRLAVSATSLVGIGAVRGARVMCLRYPPRGLVILGFLELPTPVIVHQFEIDDTWTKPEGLRGIWVELQGPGGGSGGCAATAANQTSGSGGGGGGGYAKFWVPATDLPATVAVTVGQGGVGGAAGANNGSTGTDSVFGTFGSIDGGQGGAGGGTAAFSGAATSQKGGAAGENFVGSAVDPVVIQGSDGGTGIRVGNSPTSIPGRGGASFWGGATEIGTIVSPSTLGQIASIAGWFAGGGASGAANMGIAGAPAQAGSDGADGLVYVTEIYY